MDLIKSKPQKKLEKYQVVCIINIVLSILLVFGYIISYYKYKSMGALNGDSFLFMAAFEIIIITGLTLMAYSKIAGFYIYLVGQLISFIYPIVTGTIDTVWGLIIIPAIIVPVIFAIFYYRNLKKMH